MALSDAERQAKRRKKLTENSKKMERYEAALVSAIELLKGGLKSKKNPASLLNEAVNLLESALNHTGVENE
jgi:exonuclease VII small subunit